MSYFIAKAQCGGRANEEHKVAHPFRKPDDYVRYFDKTQDREEDSPWSGRPSRQVDRKRDRCDHPDEHRGVLVDVETLVERNRLRQLRHPGTPAVRFYAFVQHEGEIVCTKRHHAHAVVSIGQSLGVARNYVCPGDVVDLYKVEKNFQKKRRCSCPDGPTYNALDAQTLNMRLFAP